MTHAPSINPLSAQEIIGLLSLTPLPREGGYFRETYRSPEVIPASALPHRYSTHAPTSGRSHSTQIYFLITPSTPSRLHAVLGDEVFHFHLGDAVEQLQVSSRGEATIVTIGADLRRGDRPQVLVPRDVWQGCRVRPGGDYGYALMSCTVSPGFDWADFRTGSAATVRGLYHGAERRILEMIDALGAEDAP